MSISQETFPLDVLCLFQIQQDWYIRTVFKIFQQHSFHHEQTTLALRLLSADNLANSCLDINYEIENYKERSSGKIRGSSCLLTKWDSLKTEPSGLLQNIRRPIFSQYFQTLVKSSENFKFWILVIDFPISHRKKREKKLQQKTGEVSVRICQIKVIKNGTQNNLNQDRHSSFSNSRLTLRIATAIQRRMEQKISINQDIRRKRIKRSLALMTFESAKCMY